MVAEVSISAGTLDSKEADEKRWDNPASGRVMEKAGFEKVAFFKEHHYIDGRYVDVIHWSLLNSSGNKND